MKYTYGAYVVHPNEWATNVDSNCFEIQYPDIFFHHVWINTHARTDKFRSRLLEMDNIVIHKIESSNRL